MFELGILDDLCLFAFIVKNNTFSAASAKLNIQQSTISRRILSLEEKLNTKLFIRGKYKLELTDIAQEIYDIIHSDLDSLENKLDDLINNKDELRGIITIVLPPVFAEMFIIPYLSDFYNKYPKITISLFYDFQDLSNYGFNFDVAVTTVFPKKDYFVVRKLFSESVYLCASPTYLHKNAHIPINQPNDLYAHHCFVPKLQNVAYSDWKFVNNATGGEEYVSFDSMHGMFDNSYAAVSLARSGLGICPILKFIAEKYIQENELARVLPEYTLDKLDYYIVKPNSLKNKRVDAFISFLEYCISKVK